MHALHRAQRCTRAHWSGVCAYCSYEWSELCPLLLLHLLSLVAFTVSLLTLPPFRSTFLLPRTTWTDLSGRGLNNVYTRVYKRDVFTHANGPRLRPMTFVFDARWWSLWWGDWEDSCIDALHEIYFDRCSMDDKIMKIKFKGYFFLFAFAFGLNHVCQEFYIMHVDSLYNFWSIWRRMNEQWKWRD